MLTKREYCEAIVKEEMEILGIPERKEAHCFIYQSSLLAVALEFLGELDEQEKEYSSTRGGVIERYLDFNPDGSFKDVYFLSLREMISLLPDVVVRKENET